VQTSAQRKNRKDERRKVRDAQSSMNPHLEAYRCTAQTADDADWGRGERFGVAKPLLEEIQTATVWVAVETTLPLTGCTLSRG
jgi:hypothetical protein